ncbi:MAG: rhomboid family intramembrane serine protease [Lachnospiraceae bacterium]|nr:rhomboid family intramembrane serine protease [Lachnospiraceae bacterium]
MKFLDKLERKLGKYAINNLMVYICVLYVVGLIISLVNPSFYYQYLSLNTALILRGQVWRLVTFLIQPPNTNLFFFIFTLYLYYMLGKTLERTWGAFRFNVYYFSGVIFTIIGSFLVYFITGRIFLLDTYYINMSIFLAFAFVYPDMQLLLMFLIPIKIKWLAYLDIALFVYEFITGNGATRIAIICALLNFIIFFFLYINPVQRIRQKQRQRAFSQAMKGPGMSGYSRQGTRQSGTGNTAFRSTNSGGIVHRCHVCGRTSLTDPDLEFRYCSKCNGNYEYCQDHLFTHEHVR